MDISGFHSFFHYYGEVHLLVNLCFYITRGMERDELIYICRPSGVYNRLLDALKAVGVEVEKIYPASIEELISANNRGGLDLLRERISDLTVNARREGFSGVRYISEASHAVRMTSEVEFLNLERELTAAISGIRFSMLCLYDFEEYLMGKHIPESLLDEVLMNHNYRLYQFRLESIADRRWP